MLIPRTPSAESAIDSIPHFCVACLQHLDLTCLLEQGDAQALRRFLLPRLGGNQEQRELRSFAASINTLLGSALAAAAHKVGSGSFRPGIWQGLTTQPGGQTVINFDNWRQVGRQPV
jgi:hypothetical protein